MNINLVYSTFAVELQNEDVNHIIIDLEEILNLPLPLMTASNHDNNAINGINIKNYNLNAVMLQLNSLSSLIENELLTDTIVSVTNCKLLGKYLHMQVLGYLRNNLASDENQVELLGYPSEYRKVILEKYSQIGERLQYYAPPSNTTSIKL